MFGKWFSSGVRWLSMSRLPSLLLPNPFVLAILVSAIGLSSGCGNKGDLYMEVDPVTREQLDTASQQLLQEGQPAGEPAGDAEAARDSESKLKKRKQPTR